MAIAQRTPPHDNDAETAVLCAILPDRDALIQVSDQLEPDHFYHPHHVEIYRCMIELFSDREPIDLVTLGDRLKKKKMLTEIGGTAYLTKLTTAVPTASSVLHHANIVRDLAIKRFLIHLSAEISDSAFDESKDTRAILDIAEQRVFSVAQKRVDRSFYTLKKILAESFDRLEELQQNSGGLRGIPTGYTDVDNTLAGLQKSNLVVLAARPGVGKTAFSLCVARNASVDFGKRIAYFSLEMSKEEIVDRLLVNQAEIDAWRLKTGRLDETDFDKLSEAMGVLAEAKIFIDDVPGQTVLEIRTKSRRLMAEHGIDLIIVDYLQLMHGTTKDNRVQEVSEISQGLKNLARELQVPVFALSQLNRAVESRGTKVPQLSDLRESGSIEQDSDVVMFLYREEDEAPEHIKLNIAKHRNGALRTVDLFFRGDRVKFYGMDEKR